LFNYHLLLNTFLQFLLSSESMSEPSDYEDTDFEDDFNDEFEDTED